MALSSGTRLGPYEVVEPVGAGGMGEVYRARDTRLGRDVAVKVLPAGVADDPRALARLEREAKAVAALSHPNILALFDLGEASGTRFVVTELLEGETLRARITTEKGPLPVRRALEIAVSIAEGLASAHEKGIVHRDVKPENVFLTKDGPIKLLDFGLAKYPDPGPDGFDTRSPTAERLTDPGSTVGTIAYMSPEQARGDAVGFPTDQFSLGSILYEMLAGTRPFRGSSAAETMTAIIRDEPEPLERLAPRVPAPVRWLVERLHAKEAGHRWNSTRDLARDLSSLRAHLSEAASGTAAVPATRLRRTRLALALGPLAVALGVAATFALLHSRERLRPHPVPGRFEIRLPEGYFLEPNLPALALSPDGKLLVFAAFAWKKPYEEMGPRQLFARPLDSLEARPIAGTENGTIPFFSPDGLQLGFRAFENGKAFLRRVPVGGGAVQGICECNARFGAAWTADGTILFSNETGPLRKVSASGGTPEPATTLDVAAGEVSHRLPHLLPDGRTVLYTALRWETEGMAWEKVRIYAQRPGETGRTLLVEGGSDGRWAPPGLLLFAREGNLLAAPLDAKAQRLTGKPEPLLDGVRHAVNIGATSMNSGAAQVVVGGNRFLAWVPGSVYPRYSTSVTWMDASGKETPLTEEAEKGPVLSALVSPDGRRVLQTYNYPGLQAEVIDLARGARRQATFAGSPSCAIWGPGEERITFTSDHEGPIGIYTRRVDAGPEEIETLWKPKDRSELCAGSWAGDGKVLAFVRGGAPSSTGDDIWLLEAGKEPRPFVASRFDEVWPSISPDGRWLLYGSNESGRSEVFARPLSGGGGPIQVSSGHGEEARWSRDGESVYYWTDVDAKHNLRAMCRVRVARTSGSLSFGAPEKLFEGRFHISSPGHSWDVGPDGRFLALKIADAAASRAFLEKLLSNRIVVDTGGAPLLLQGAKAGP